MATPTTLPASFTAGQVLTAQQMNDLRGAFRILQVVSTVKTDSFSSTSATWADVTGLSVSITPSATSSKVLVVGFFNTGFSGDIANSFRLVRDSTEIFIGDAASNRPRATFTNTPGPTTNSNQWAWSPVFLDSPNTTSATTYKLQIIQGAGGTGYVNRSGSDRDTTGYDARTASSITVFEVSA